MTANLRGPDDPAPNDWPRRRPILVDLIRRARPDLIGTQEALYERLNELEADLSDLGYRWIGIGREGGSRSEFVAILYRHQRLSPVGFDHLWLSEHPRLIGSVTWGHPELPRMATWVRFGDRVTGEEWVHVNTHLDHQDEETRVHQAGVLRRVVDDHLGAGRHLVLTGDFNAEAGSSPTYAAVAEGLVDAWVAANGVGPRPTTFHGYAGTEAADGPDADHIDWILTSPDVKVRSARLETVLPTGGTYPSDHWPVTADLVVPEGSGIAAQKA